MKKGFLFIACLLTGLIIHAQVKMYIHKNDHITLGAPLAVTDSIYFDNTQTISYFVINDSITPYPVSAIDSLTFGNNSDTVFVTYNSSYVSVINPFAFEGVTVLVNGMDVTVYSTIQTQDIYYMLSGTTTDGTFKMYSRAVKSVLHCSMAPPAPWPTAPLMLQPLTAHQDCLKTRKPPFSAKVNCCSAEMAALA